MEDKMRITAEPRQSFCIVTSIPRRIPLYIALFTASWLKLVGIRDDRSLATSSERELHHQEPDGALFFPFGARRTACHLLHGPRLWAEISRARIRLRSLRRRDL